MKRAPELKIDELIDVTKKRAQKTNTRVVNLV